MAVHNIWRRSLNRIIQFVVITTLVLFSAPTIVFAEGETPPVNPAAPPAQTTAPPVVDPSASTPAVATPSTPATDPAAPAPPSTASNDGAKYVYNSQTGLWENGIYSWNPVTNETKPMAGSQYTIDPATGEWTKKPPATPITTDDSSSSTNDSESMADSSTASDGANAVTNPDTDNPSTLSANSATNNQPGGSATTLNQTGNGLFDMLYNAAVSNNLNSTANTGDAVVGINNLAGDAISGSATAMANIINLLQSTWNLTSNAFTTFIGNLTGDVVGDLFLDPGQIDQANAALDNNTHINTTQNTAINNTITLDATSGDATVTKNNQAGSATTGDAAAIANLVNAINSSVAAQQSFLGVLNIFGNLNGDILLPPDLINTLLAANAVGTLDTTQIANSEIIGQFNNDQTITNNINSSATSGNSTVDKNNVAGNAMTGDAQTNVTVLNMTGRQVVGKDALLVFVNVLGKWVGVIVNAPTGSTSAALGSNITQNNSLAIDATANQAITNDVTVSAQSGDATVDHNNQAGNATSGDAKTAVNVLNINNSDFSLSDWFGILFINVFGTWNGSFGIDTAAGTITPPVTSLVASDSNNSSAPVSEIHAFRFVPSDNGTYTMQATDESTATAALANAHVLGQTTSSPQSQHAKDTAKAAQNNWLFSALGITIAASLLGTERIITNRTKKNES